MKWCDLHFKGWEQKRSNCFFTYIHLDLFCLHPSIFSMYIATVMGNNNFSKYIFSASASDNRITDEFQWNFSCHLSMTTKVCCIVCHLLLVVYLYGRLFFVTDRVCSWLYRLNSVIVLVWEVTAICTLCM